jgi:AAA15 family ATPase/GTPase
MDYGNPRREMKVYIAKSDEVQKLVLNMLKEMDMDIEELRIEERETNLLEIFTKHSVDGYVAELNFADESSGTRKLFGMLQFIAQSLVDGAALIIDELDAKIHPVLLRHIIMMFTDRNINRHGAQLIFTSHDLTTMSSEIFRRDEIWFVAKGNSQNSKLYSLVEFKNEKGETPRKDAKFDKQYLEGRYGADPYLRKIIDWSEVHA